MAENNKLILPLLMTRGIILFPGHTTHVDAAREYSTRAIDEARNAADDLIIIVSQINPEIDNPNPVTDIYKVGTLCKI